MHTRETIQQVHLRDFRISRARRHSPMFGVLRRVYRGDEIRRAFPLRRTFSTRASTAVVDAYHRLNDGYTPLHFAAQEGHSEIVKLLLSTGIDTNRASNDGHSPLQLAASQGYTEITKLLTVENYVTVVVPPGAIAGQMLQMTVNGRMVQVQTPQGLKEGMTFQMLV